MILLNLSSMSNFFLTDLIMSFKTEFDSLKIKINEQYR